MITLRQLEFALAVAKHRHFKRAAEECNISQSALSLGIAELEKQLDTQILSEIISSTHHAHRRRDFRACPKNL